MTTIPAVKHSVGVEQTKGGWHGSFYGPNGIGFDVARDSDGKPVVYRTRAEARDGAVAALLEAKQRERLKAEKARQVVRSGKRFVALPARPILHLPANRSKG